MIHVGFTGTQAGMTSAQKDTVREALQRLKKHDRVVGHHGACIGADDQFDVICIEEGISREVHPCTLKWKQIDCSQRTQTPVKLHAVKQPLIRNRDIVFAGQVLLAAPSGYLEELRSGTWATIRFARKVHRSTFVIGPNGFWRLDGPEYPLLPREL